VQLLPTTVEQEWIVVALASLIREHGHEPFVAGPIVRPDREHFPESKGLAAYVLDRATRRILQYAGMGDLDVSFEIFTEGDPRYAGLEAGCHSTAAYFAGIENGCCLFGLNMQGSGDAEYLAGVMCHEVGHAYRRKHGLEVEDRDEEERLTDLTAAYLGFGILAANNAWRYRASGDGWSTSKTGYLTPQAMSFLLALQVWARDLPSRQRKAVANLLEPNQRSFFAAAVAHMEKDGSTFRARLALPDRASWPAVRTVDSILRPLPEFHGWDVDRVEEQLRAALPNTGYPVFRIRKSKSLVYAAFGLVLASFVGLIITALAKSLLLWVPFPVVGAAVGAFLGRTPFDVCSNSACRLRLPDEASTCPHCGGTIRGRIRHEGERWVAEEHLEAGVDSVDFSQL
jgi:hypothetical protein